MWPGAYDCVLGFHRVSGISSSICSKNDRALGSRVQCTCKRLYTGNPKSNSIKTKMNKNVRKHFSNASNVKWLYIEWLSFCLLLSCVIKIRKLWEQYLLFIGLPVVCPRLSRPSTSHMLSAVAPAATAVDRKLVEESTKMVDYSRWDHIEVIFYEILYI